MRNRVSATVQVSKPIHPDDGPSGRATTVRRDAAARPNGQAPIHNDHRPSADSLGPMHLRDAELVDAVQLGDAEVLFVY